MLSFNQQRFAHAHQKQENGGINTQGIKEANMRTMLKVTIPVESGNERISDGTLPKAMETILGELEPEASYFFTNNGERCMFIVFDMEDPSEIPSVAEPFFMAFNARVEFQPVMNLQDLQKALSGIDTTVKKYHSMPKPRAA